MLDLSPLLLFLNIVACYRLTRLVTTDTFPPILAVRRWIEGHSRGKTRPVFDQQGTHVADATKPGFFAELITCPFCASMWVAAGVVAVHSLWPDVWAYAAYGLTLSAVASPLIAYEPD